MLFIRSRPRCNTWYYSHKYFFDMYSILHTCVRAYLICVRNNYALSRKRQVCSASPKKSPVNPVGSASNLLLLHSHEIVFSHVTLFATLHEQISILKRRPEHLDHLLMFGLRETSCSISPIATSVKLA